MIAAATILNLMVLSLIASPLSDLAGSMAPGTWKQLTTLNLANTITVGNSTGGIMPYSDNATWDPNSQQLLFWGGDHGGPLRHVAYRASTNTWRVISESIGWTHGYDFLDIDTKKGIFYVGVAPTVKTFNVANDSWGALPAIPRNMTGPDPIGPGALAFFPALGGPVYINGNGVGSVVSYNNTTRQWRQLARGLDMGLYNNFAEYSPVAKAVMCGGGNFSRKVYKIDESGQVRPMGNAPFEVGIHQTIITIDPVSGRYIVIANGNKFYEYDISNDNWRSLGGPIPPLDWGRGVPPVTGIIATPVSNYGVIMFVTFNFTNSKVHLYKHSPGEVSVNAPDNAMAIANGSMKLAVNPNPFNPVTTFRIHCELPVADCGLKIFDMQGKLLIDFSEKIRNQIIWDATDLPAGIYLARLQTSGITYTKQLILIR
jgi:hypothetical protein